MINLSNDLISAIGMLNRAAKQSNMIWAIKKYPWEDKYHVEVSSPNFDGRESLHIEPEHIDDSIERMVEFCN